MSLALICSAIPWLARPLHVWLLVIALVVGVTLGLLGAVLAVPPSLWTDLVVVLVVAWSGGLLLGRGMAPRFCPVLLVFLCLSVLDVLLAVGGYPQAPWTVASSSPLVYADFLLVLPWGRFAINLVDLLLITALAEHWRRRGGGYLLALLPFGEDEGAAHFVRRQWHDGQWFFSVVDVVRVLTDSPNPRNYWSMLKRKLHDEGASESYTKCVQLKMRSLDGKNYATDAADVETMLRIVQTIPSPRVEPIKQWLAKVGRERLEEIAENRDLLAGMTEDQRRLFLHGQVADRNTTLTETAAGVGVVTARDFALFQDWGYRGLYGGETARDIAARKGLGRGEKVLDWMGPEELGDNLFRILQTEAKLRRDATEGVTGKGHAHATHHAVGREARATIERLGGTMPEDLPTPAESVKQLERKEQKRIEAERQPSLFPADTDAEGGDYWQTCQHTCETDSLRRLDGALPAKRGRCSRRWRTAHASASSAGCGRSASASCSRRFWMRQTTRSRRSKSMPQDAGQTRPLTQTSTTQEQDIATARWFYAELLKFEERMEAAYDQMHNRGRWLEAEGHLRKARESLQLFIGERVTADIEQRIEVER